MSKIHEMLFDYFQKPAAEHCIDTLTVGLKYTAVMVQRQAGVAYSWYNGRCCTGSDDYTDYEGCTAKDLLEKLNSENPLDVTKALALVNALNMMRAATFPEDTSVRTIADTIKAGPGRKIVMVGLFRPVVSQLRELGVDLYIADINQGIGSSEELYNKLGSWAEAAVITSTSIIGGTFDEMMTARKKHIPTVLLGPSTPMVPEIFQEYGVDLLAGTVPLSMEKTISIIRQGGGTRDFQKFGKKVVYAVQ